MKNVIVAALLSVLLAGSRPAAAATHTQGEEAGYAVAAAALNLVYVPAKAVVALGGLMLGGATGLLTGGNTRAAYAIWVPAASGTFFLTPSHIDESRPIAFFGDDYIDRPSRNWRTDRSAVYDSIYMP